MPLTSPFVPSYVRVATFHNGELVGQCILYAGSTVGRPTPTERPSLCIEEPRVSRTALRLETVPAGLEAVSAKPFLVHGEIEPKTRFGLSRKGQTLDLVPAQPGLVTLKVLEVGRTEWPKLSRNGRPSQILDVPCRIHPENGGTIIAAQTQTPSTFPTMAPGELAVAWCTDEFRVRVGAADGWENRDRRLGPDGSDAKYPLTELFTEAREADQARGIGIPEYRRGKGDSLYLEAYLPILSLVGQPWRHLLWAPEMSVCVVEGEVRLEPGLHRDASVFFALLDDDPAQGYRWQTAWERAWRPLLPGDRIPLSPTAGGLTLVPLAGEFGSAVITQSVIQLEIVYTLHYSEVMADTRVVVQSDSREVAKAKGMSCAAFVLTVWLIEERSPQGLVVSTQDILDAHQKLYAQGENKPDGGWYETDTVSQNILRFNKGMKKQGLPELLQYDKAAAVWRLKTSPLVNIVWAGGRPALDV